MGSDFSSRTVLLVDDEPAVRDVMARILTERLGCKIAAESSAEAGLDRMRDESVDVLVADMIMPGLHGLEFITRVREAWPGIDIVVLTGFPEKFPYVDVAQAGARDFIPKPFNPGEVEAKIARIFEERRLREGQAFAEEKYRRLFELSMNGMLLVQGEDCRIVDANRAFCELSGYAEDQLLGASLFDVIDNGEVPRVKSGVALFAEGGQGTLGDVPIRAAGGHDMSLDVNVTFVSFGGEALVMMVFRDVTEVRQLEQRLKQIAETDELTGLANKRSFRARLEWTIARSRGEGFPLTLVFVDVDDFKKCNDTFGHEVGDRALRAVGKAIRSSIRTGGDEGFRYGGDEFAVLLPGADSDQASVVARRMKDQLAASIETKTTISIGIAQYEAPMDASAFICAADKALYAVKARGKNGLSVA